MIKTEEALQPPNDGELAKFWEEVKEIHESEVIRCCGKPMAIIGYDVRKTKTLLFDCEFCFTAEYVLRCNDCGGIRCRYTEKFDN